ncbi:short chain dehydrogenase/reductase, putative [Paecilomyces variotii No. 5]|uniref:Short chain dehydrogenase/reductase, putative n=1 Tax=Byssochlamys spectabilis (strain No. 5 / NBRC 109023) TaxID=1356009 RepID=V5I5A7_BYSSN|nr:short chain dehydrogenase/reductase, putative [Paecilomyces variotii No. 5]
MTTIKLPSSVTDTLTLAGAATSFYLFTQFARHLYIYLRPSSIGKYRSKDKETWALVTGASDGIGLGFAQELCRRGFNVFLHGRNREKLLGIQARLKAEYPAVNTRIIVFDAGGSTANIDAIAREVGDANLRVLVNNVGGQTGVSHTYKRFDELTHDEVEYLLSLNARFTTHITRVLLPILERNEPGLIMNVSSIASAGFPWLSIYSSTKGFIDSFSGALNVEMKACGRKIEVMALRVGSVSTAAMDVKANLFTPTARTMASAALNRVGCGEHLVWGYWWHRLQGLGFDVLPRGVMLSAVTGRLRQLKADADRKEKSQ